MNSICASLLISFLLLSIVSVQLTASASFPNPPQRPPSDASPDEQALFWKLLHNYYAIIARPRFGKRSDLNTLYSKQPSSSFESENIPNVNRIGLGNYYSFDYPEQRRR